MKKLLKRIIILIILLIIVCIIIVKVKDKTKNENSNMSNMGLVLEYKGTTYYNKYEKGIFAVKNDTETRLTDETAYSLTAYKDKIYYMTVADFNNVVIKYVDINSGDIKNIATIYTSISKFYIANDNIFYFKNDGENGICVADMNGENETLLITGFVQDFVIANNKVLYINNDNQICSFSLKKQEHKILNEEFYVKKIQLVDHWIYFYNEDENALFKISEDGKKYGLVSVLVNNEVYNIYGKYVYYFDPTNSKICRMQLDNSNKCDDIVAINITKTRINVAGDILYYLDESKDEAQNYQMYRVKINGEKTKEIEY